MKVILSGCIVLILTLGCSWSSSLYATDIYKTYDANGDPVFTDRPPTPESKPISLRALSIVEAPSYRSSQTAQSQTSTDDNPPTLNEMRRNFRDFRLVSPAPDENIWGTGNEVTIAWDAGAPLADGMAVIFYIDGQPVTEATSQASFTSGRLDRGAHTARADLLNANNRVVMSTPEVTFYIMQQSVNNAARRPGG